MNRQQIATFIALAFHISGFIAIAFFKSTFFISLTSLNLLVCAVLIFWTQQMINSAFLVFCTISFFAGFFAEYIGVNTGVLFGNYTYGTSLGPKLYGVPLIIGIQWMVITYCIGICMHTLHKKIASMQVSTAEMSGLNKKAVAKNTRRWTLLSTIIDGALLAILFDWVMEPAATKLGYWKWNNDEIPGSNYYSWGFVSLVILAVFYYLPFKKENIFAVHLLLIQFMFFLLLNTFYQPL